MKRQLIKAVAVLAGSAVGMTTGMIAGAPPAHACPIYTPVLGYEELSLSVNGPRIVVGVTSAFANMEVVGKAYGLTEGWVPATFVTGSAFAPPANDLLVLPSNSVSC